MREEPHYEDDEELVPTRIPKWRKASSEWEVKILHAVGRRRNPPLYLDHQEKTSVLEITEKILSLTVGVESKYPAEWVDNCIEWARTMWGNNQPVGIKALISLIRNDSRKAEFIVRWSRDHKDMVSRMDQEEGDAYLKRVASKGHGL